MKQTVSRNLALISGILMVCVFAGWLFALAGGGYALGGVFADVEDVDFYIWMCVAAIFYWVVRGVMSIYTQYGCYWEAIAGAKDKLNKPTRFVLTHFKSAWYILIIAMIGVQVTGSVGYGALALGVLLLEMFFILLVDACSTLLLKRVCENRKIPYYLVSWGEKSTSEK